MAPNVHTWHALLTWHSKPNFMHHPHMAYMFCAVPDLNGWHAWVSWLACDMCGSHCMHGLVYMRDSHDLHGSHPNFMHGLDGMCSSHGMCDPTSMHGTYARMSTWIWLWRCTLGCPLDTDPGRRDWCETKLPNASHSQKSWFPRKLLQTWSIPQR